MKIAKHLLLALFFLMNFYEGSAGAAAKLPEEQIAANITHSYFFDLVDKSMEQKRRTYFGVNDFTIEERIADVWFSHIKDFIKSNSIADIKFMSIDLYVIFVNTFIVSDKFIYKLNFKYDIDNGNFHLETQKKLSLTDNKLDKEIENLKKSYFIIEPDLWTRSRDLSTVFSMFADTPKPRDQSRTCNFARDNKYVGAYTKRYPNEELDIFLIHLEKCFK